MAITGTILCICGWIASIGVKQLNSIPFLCIGFIFQCIAVVIFINSEVKEEKEIKEESESLVFNSLTQREKEIVEHIVKGENYKEIGEVLCISPNTVRNHSANIYSKLSVKNKIELVNLLKNQ